MIDETNQSQSDATAEDGVFYGEPINEFQKPQRDVSPAMQDESRGYSYGRPIDEEPKEKPAVEPSYIAGIGADIPTPYEFKKDEGPKPDYPEAPTIANMPGISKKAAHVAMLSDDPNLIARSIMRDNPDAQYKIDSAGFPYMELPAKEEGGKGEVYYLDKPGINMLDFSRGVARGALSIPTGAAAGAAYLAGPLAGTAAMGVAGATDAAIRQGLVHALTGEQTFEPKEIAAEGAISAAIPAVGAGVKRIGSWAMGLSEAPNLWEALPRGVKNRIDALMSNAEKRGGIQAGSDVGDMLLDDPNFVGAGKALMRRDDAASQQLADSLTKREASTQARIDAAVTHTLGQEPIEKAAIKEFIELPKVEASPAIREAIADATSRNVEIPTRDIVERLDKEISTAKGPIRAALNNVRNMLLNPEREGMLMTGPAGAKSALYETRPEAIDNARTAIQTMMDKGFREEGFNVTSAQLKNQARILGEINTELSNRLKAGVPGLKEPFEQYERMYAQKKAADLGYNFARGGENPLTPNEIQRFLADNKELRPYVEAGARLRIDEMMKNTPNDLAAIKKAVKKEGDYSRENLNILFGKNKVQNLADFAEKEANRQATSKSLLDELQKTRQKTQAGLMGEATGPSEDITSLWGLGKKAVSLAPTIKRGTFGKEYQSGMADLLTKNRAELDAILEARGISDKAARQKLIEDLRAGAVAGTAIPAAGSIDQAKEQADGGRVAYKSGGRVKNARAVAQSLLREIDQTRKMIGKKTEDILSMPDDAVATALTIARGNV